MKKTKPFGLLILLVITLTGCVSNKPKTSECIYLPDGQYMCEKQSKSEANKIVDDFFKGAEKSASNRKDDRDKRHLPPKNDNREDIVSGIINSIFRALGRLFSSDD